MTTVVKEVLNVSVASEAEMKVLTFTPPHAGEYTAHVQADWPFAGCPLGARMVSLYREPNDAENYWVAGQHIATPTNPAGFDGVPLNAAWHFTLAAGETIDVFLWQDSGMTVPCKRVRLVVTNP